MKGLIRLVLAFALISGAAEAGHAQNLIIDGGFETPVVPNGSGTGFGLGQTFSKWVVTGDPGDVVITSGMYTANGFTFPAHSGQQWLNLFVTSSTPIGVQQTVTTNPGSVYQLTFWVGNAYGFGGNASSTVNVFVNDQLLTSVINTGGKGKTALVWHQFSANFTASTDVTTVTFINANPAGYGGVNGLDNVSLELVPNAAFPGVTGQFSIPAR